MRLGAAFLVLMAVLSGLLLAACSATAEPTATAPAPTKPVATAAPGAEPTATTFYGQAATLEEFEKRFPFPPPPSKAPARYGGTLIVPTIIWTNLDPRIGSAGELQRLTYQSLAEQKLGWEYPELQYQMEVVPMLAEKWENPDPSTYIFHIRKGVKWQNLPPVNGREFVAEDVKYAFEEHMKGGIQFAKVADIKSLEVLDKYTLKMTLKAPYPGIVVDKLGAPVVPAIFSKEANEQPGSLKDNIPVGTGPYIVKEIKSGEGFLMEANPDYWEKDYHKTREGNKLPYLEKVRGLVFKDLPAQVAAFRVGQVDALILTDWETVRDLLKTNPDIFSYRVPSATWGNQTMYFHLDRKPYSDVRVRRAISMAIDRQMMREVLYGSRTEGEIYGPLPWVWTWPELPRDYSVLGPYFEYNPKKAKELLAEAGYPNGFKASMQFTVSYTNPQEEGALLAQEMLRQIGIDITLEKAEPAAQNASKLNGNWPDLLWDTIAVAGPGYDDMVYWSYHSKGPANLNPDKIKDPDLDKMLDEQRGKYAVGSPEHVKAARDIFKYLADKVYRVSTVTYTHYEVQQPWVQGGASAPYNWWIGYGQYAHKYVWFSDKAPKR